MKKDKISEIIGNINIKYVDEADAYANEATAAYRPAWMKWGAVAACLALVAVLGIGIFQNNLFGGGYQSVTLDNGSKICFNRSDSVTEQPDISFQIETRNLTDDETEALFAGLPVTAYALFNAEDGSIIGIEGEFNNMKIVVSVNGIDINDTVIDGEKTVSDVEGVPINAGYFISGKNYIYYADFELGESNVYIENAGLKDEREEVMKEIAGAVWSIIGTGKIDIAHITR